MDRSCGVDRPAAAGGGTATSRAHRMTCDSLYLTSLRTIQTSEATMNPDDKPPGDMMGAIPRKKLPPAPAVAAASEPSTEDDRPRKKKASLPMSRSSSIGSISMTSSSVRPQRPKKERIRWISEFPMILRVRTKGMDLEEGLPLSTRVSSRQPKRRRPTYQEVDVSDPDDLVDSDDDLPSRRKKKKLGQNDETAADEEDLLMIDNAVPAAPANSDGPPPGVLSTLWYSNESLLHLFVMEKVCGWKTRTAFVLVDEATGEEVTLEAAEATALQTAALWDVGFWNNARKRMEVSRIVPQKCPVILALAAEKSQEMHGAAETVTPSVETKPAATSPMDALAEAAAVTAAAATNPPTTQTRRLKLKAVHREEVLLVKWRGRSHMHCSWERAADIQRLDPNNTAANKIKRFYQNQEAIYGPNWKGVLEEERTTAANIHAQGAAAGADVHVNRLADDNDLAEQDDDYFSPQNLEVERIVGCDENEMNLQILAKQRALNIRDEQEAIRLREKEDRELETGSKSPDRGFPSLTLASGELGDKGGHGLKNMIEELLPVSKKDPTAWDPEDNVRYIVKWKGLPYAEMTWEYWRDIKRDAVDEAEDFWHRQKAPDLDQVVKESKRPHPHIRDFRKLQASPVYGTSDRERPVASLGDDAKMSASSDDDDADAGPGFKLRSYQLEGVNWLLFNWWNRRSCILADEMGL